MSKGKIIAEIAEVAIRLKKNLHAKVNQPYSGCRTRSVMDSGYVDQLLSLYQSNDYHQILNFYSVFKNQAEVIKWMNQVPSSPPKIVHVPGPNDKIVVIPTIDSRSKYARHCVNKIFKGFHIILVEGHSEDGIFKFAKNVNLGVIEALRFDPEWVIYSNDDMFKIDDAEQLNRELDVFDSNSIDALFSAIPATYHSYPASIARLNMIGNSISKFIGIVNRDNYHDLLLKVRKKFDIHYNFYMKKSPPQILRNNQIPFIHTGSFAIISSRFLDRHKRRLFDETYINGGEDVDLSIRLSKFPERLAFINYRIGDLVGSSLGTGFDRTLREQASNAYLSYKLENGLL